MYLRVTELTSIVRLSVFYITSNWAMISDLDLGNQGHVCNMLPECDAHLCQVISKSYKKTVRVTKRTQIVNGHFYVTGWYRQKDGWVVCNTLSISGEQMCQVITKSFEVSQRYSVDHNIKAGNIKYLYII